MDAHQLAAQLPFFALHGTQSGAEVSYNLTSQGVPGHGRQGWRRNNR